MILIHGRAGMVLREQRLPARMRYSVARFSSGLSLYFQLTDRAMPSWLSANRGCTDRVEGRASESTDSRKKVFAMNTIYGRSFVAALMLAATASDVLSQDKSSVLTSIEVKMLVASNLPQDHARLQEHFGALADQYNREASRFAAAANVLSGNPNHPPAVSPSIKHRQAADSKLRAAAVLRELAAHHGRQAEGLASTAPPDGARFENGDGAPLPTDAQARAIVATADTPAEHRALEEYFVAIADQHAAAAERQMAKAQRTQASSMRSPAVVAAAVQFSEQARRSRELERDARAAADEQRRLAGKR